MRDDPRHGRGSGGGERAGRPASRTYHPAAPLRSDQLGDGVRRGIARRQADPRRTMTPSNAYVTGATEPARLPTRKAALAAAVADVGRWPAMSGMEAVQDRPVRHCGGGHRLDAPAGRAAGPALAQAASSAL